MIKISGFTDEVSNKLDDQIALLREINEQFMCPRMIDDKNIAAYTFEEFQSIIKPKLDSAGIKFSSIGSPIGKVKIDDEEGYQKQLVQLAELVKIAESMGCKYIRMFSFFMDSKADYESSFDIVVLKIKGFLKIVEGTSIVLLHENEKEIYGDVPERVLKLYHTINHPQFQLCYDSSNYIQCGVDVLTAWQQVKEFVVYYHLKDNIDGREVPLGIGQGQYQTIINELVKNGYDGFLTLEPHTAYYSSLKRLFYICPPLSLSLKNSFRVYRFIDKSMGVKAFEKVTKKQTYLWQYKAVKEILKKAGN